MKIYAISGLGANHIAFEKLIFPPNYQLEYIPWELPLEGEKLASYAIRLARNMDAEQEFGLLGLSFGGIVAQEIAQIKRPKFLLLFNTIKAHNEKPYWMRLNQRIPLYKFFPHSLLNHTTLLCTISKLMRTINPQRPDIDALYVLRDNRYTRWAIREIIFWDNNTRQFNFPIYHFHGTWDYLFPVSNIQNVIPIHRGGHLAIYEKADLVNDILKKIL